MYTPYYSAYQMFDFLDKNNEEARDRTYLRRMYSARMSAVQRIVEEECDKMEYDGSMMFDEYPDKLMLQKKCSHILDRVAEENGGQCPCKDEDWLKDTISVLLYNEMYKRRCRRRDRRRPVYPGMFG